MVFAPFIFALAEKQQWQELKRPKKLFALLIFIGLLWLINYQVFLQKWGEGTYWLVCVLFLFASYLINSLAARFLLVLTSLLATIYTLKGFGPFEYGSPNLNLLYLQMVIVLFAATVLFIKTFIQESASKIVLMILFFGFCLISIATNWIALEEKAYKLSEFTALVSKVKSNLKQAETHYSMLLRSGGGLISLFPNTDSQAWRTYTSNLTLKENYAAINGVGIVKFLERSELPAHAAKIKAMGITDFTFRHLDNSYREKFNTDYIITFLEPIENNGPARGLNLGSEPFRREGADAARLKNTVVATKPIQLVQDKIKGPGFLIFNPIWVEALDKRQGKEKIFWGWCYAPIISDTFFKTALGELANYLNISMDTNSESVFKQGVIENSQLNKSRFIIDEELSLFNIIHHLKIYPTEAFFKNRQSFPVLVGIMLTLLLILLTAVISGLRSFASKLAIQVQQRTDELDKERMKTLLNSKLASLGELSAGIAHEINNPLAIISGAIGLIPNFLNDPEKLKRKIETIEKSCDRIAKIVGSLKKFSRSSDTMDFNNFPISTLINESVSLIEHKANRFSTKVIIECETSATIYCNDVEIEQVIVNLVSNAIDAIKNFPNRWVKVSALENSEQVILRVTDSGTGIPLQIREKIFDPFYTTKPVGEGTGLGLSVSKGILDEHKASISILADSPNTCFEIRFNKIKETKYVI